jgi:hypothetical protein
MWSVDTTKAAFLGVTAHWIEVKSKSWVMRSEVIGLRSVSGDHGGENLGRYFVGVCDRIGLTSKVKIIYPITRLSKYLTLFIASHSHPRQCLK